MPNGQALRRRLHALSAMLALASLLIPLLAIVGWYSGLPLLQSLHPNLVAMSLLTAGLLVVAAGSVLLLQETRPIAWRRLGHLGGGLVAAVALVKLADGRLFPEQFGTFLGGYGSGGVYPLAMSDYTAVAMVLVGVAVALSAWDTRRGLMPSQFVAMAGLFVAVFVLVGYVYDVRAIVYGNANFPMALNTAVAMLLLSMGVLCLRPDKGPMAIYVYESPGGNLMRRLSPVFLLLPFVFGWLRLQGERAGLYEAWFGVALMTTAMALSFFGLTWWNAFLINRKEAERERAQEEIRRREGEFRALAEHSPDVIARFDPAGRYLYVNQAIRRVTGHGPEAYLGRRFDEFGMSDEQAEFWRTRMAAVFRDGTPSSLEFAYQDPAGAPLYMESRLVPELEPAGSVTSLLVVTRDLTAMRQAYVRLQEADKAKDELLGVVSHELRTPLNFIMGFVSFLQDGLAGPLNAEQQLYADKAMAGAERLLGLVDDLLIYTRMQAGSFEVEAVPAPYGQLVEEVAGRFAEPAARKGLTLTVEAEVPGLPCLDAGRVALVLTKLLDNAFNFTPPGGAITLSARIEGNELVTAVSDTGIGIAPAQRAEVFGHFRQLDMSSTREVGGLGLGLAISRGIVEAHGGTIGVESAPGRGSCFWFRLPLATER